MNTVKILLHMLEAAGKYDRIYDIALDDTYDSSTRTQAIEMVLKNMNLANSAIHNLINLNNSLHISTNNIFHVKNNKCFLNEVIRDIKEFRRRNDDYTAELAESFLQYIDNNEFDVYKGKMVAVFRFNSSPIYFVSDSYSNAINIAIKLSKNRFYYIRDIPQTISDPGPVVVLSNR